MAETRTRPTRSETRERILRAAGEVFAARGYDGTSLDRVAAAAGLTKGAVYSSFSGKDELFFALVTDRLGQRLALVADAADGQRDLRQLFAQAEEQLSALFTTQRDWHLLFIECWIRAVRDSERREDWARQRREARAAIADFLERHSAASGETLPVPAADIALAAMALSNGLAMEYIADPERADPRLFSRILGQLVSA